MKSAPFLLFGHDFEGDSRELWCESFAQASKIASEVSRTDASGPAWLDWEIWGHGEKEWESLATSEAKP